MRNFIGNLLHNAASFLFNGALRCNYLAAKVLVPGEKVSVTGDIKVNFHRLSSQSEEKETL